jgi:hypothetical protein
VQATDRGHGWQSSQRRRSHVGRPIGAARRRLAAPAAERRAARSHCGDHRWRGPPGPRGLGHVATHSDLRPRHRQVSACLQQLLVRFDHALPCVRSKSAGSSPPKRSRLEGHRSRSSLRTGITLHPRRSASSTRCLRSAVPGVEISRKIHAFRWSTSSRTAGCGLRIWEAAGSFGAPVNASSDWSPAGQALRHWRVDSWYSAHVRDLRPLPSTARTPSAASGRVHTGAAGVRPTVGRSRPGQRSSVRLPF